MGEQKNSGLASSAGPSQLSGSWLKWWLNQMWLSSAQIGAGSGSGSSQRLAGAAATLGGDKWKEKCPEDKKVAHFYGHWS